MCKRWVADNNRTGGVLLNLEFNRRIPKSASDNRAIADFVRKALNNELTESIRSLCAIKKFAFDVSDAPFARRNASSKLDETQTADWLTQKFGFDNEHAFFVWEPSKSAIGIVITSRQPVRVVDGIYRQLKHASKQLSGTRPGMIVARCDGLSMSDLTAIAEIDRAEDSPNSGFALIAGRLFGNEARRHLHTVAFMCSANLARATHQDGQVATTIYDGSGPIYTFINHHHPLCDNVRLDAFAELSRSVNKVSTTR